MPGRGCGRGCAGMPTWTGEEERRGWAIPATGTPTNAGAIGDEDLWRASWGTTGACGACSSRATLVMAGLSTTPG